MSRKSSPGRDHPSDLQLHEVFVNGAQLQEEIEAVSLLDPHRLIGTSQDSSESSWSESMAIPSEVCLKSCDLLMSLPADCGPLHLLQSGITNDADAESPYNPVSAQSLPARFKALVLHEPLLAATVLGVFLGILLGSCIRLARPTSNAIDLIGDTNNPDQREQSSTAVHQAIARSV